MIVYGDSKFQETMRAFVQRLQGRMLRAEGGSLEELRGLLIQAGQLEQAVLDLPMTNAEEAQRLNFHAQQCMNFAAAAFYAAWANANPELPKSPGTVDESLARMRRELVALEQGTEEKLLTVKVPEGFEFYGLYPEQYGASALRWARQHAQSGSKQVAVVGIRSIGTTLSAIVAVTLNAAGWMTQRLTVRPSGHPFDRKVELPECDFAQSSCAVVVDEGPGMSGSSMAATAEALVEVGFSRNSITFFPGHEGEPGGAASETVRRWWNSTERCVTPLSEIQWHGHSLVESLAAKSGDLCGVDGSLLKMGDLSCGQWRRIVYRDEKDWPSVAATFERTKYRYTADDGRAIVWKFVGLGAAQSGVRTGAELAFMQLAERARKNWVPAPLGIHGGFIALPWMEGTPLVAKDAADAEVLEHLGRYLAHTCGLSLSAQELPVSIERLAEMLFCNTREALGEEAAECTRRWSEMARRASLENCPSSSDGHLAPHEWIRTRAGKILKTDSVGHNSDHTIVGKQPLLWDIAGVIVEWNLAAPACARLLSTVRNAGVEVNSEALTFYGLAYAAFRMGQSSLCAGLHESNPAEQFRLRHATAAYREALQAWLAHEFIPS